MPAVCRFYLKGYCRYGRSCRFEHPGENNSSNNNKSQASGFSFTKALEETNTPSTNFSFTKALEETTYPQQYPFANQQQFYSSTPYHFNSGHQQHSRIGFNQSYNQSAGPFNQTYHQQYNNNNSNFGNFSFNAAAAAAAHEESTLRYHSVNNFGAPSFYPERAANRQFVDEIDMRLPGEQQKDNNDLTELELKAYQSDKFQFRLIPIRPPPRHLCF